MVYYFELSIYMRQYLVVLYILFYSMISIGYSHAVNILTFACQYFDVLLVLSCFVHMLATNHAIIIPCKLYNYISTL